MTRLLVIEPQPITDSVLAASNVPETDHVEWAPGTTYGNGVYVRRTSVHRTYRSVQAGNLNHDPVTDVDPVTKLGTWWIDAGATNRHRAFDNQIVNGVTHPDDIIYQLVPQVNCDALAAFGLKATEITLTIREGSETIYSETVNLLDTTQIINGWTYFFLERVYYEEIAFIEIPAYRGNSVVITVSSGEACGVGEIVIGHANDLGNCLIGTTSSLLAFSRVERDEFGNVRVIERPMVRRVEYNVQDIALNIYRLQRILTRVHAKPAVYIAGDPARGTAVYGFLNGPAAMPIGAGDYTTYSFAAEGVP
jgi:hypothetical protein